MNLIFWQNIPGMHQSALIRALASHEDVSVTLVCQEDIPQWRQETGWSKPDFGNTQVIVAPSADMVRKLTNRPDERTVQIFSGLRSYPLVWRAFRQCVRTKTQIGLYSETSDWQGIKGLLRLWRSRADTMRYGRRVSFVLAVGHLGVRWYRWSGYPDNKVYRFGYFVDPPQGMGRIGESRNSDDRVVNLIFVGRCVHQKGIDLLLHALADLSQLQWALSVVGEGPERSNLEALSQALGMSQRVRFWGAMDNIAALALMGACDLLVLPSRGKDGWGAVVNESLMQGVPVVCSDCCGSADLLVDSQRGSVVKAGSVSSLREALAYWINRGGCTPEESEQIQAWSRCISGQSAANYLLDIIENSHAEKSPPVVPWF